MKVLAINNGRDRTAYTWIVGGKNDKWHSESGFLTGNIVQRIKEFCERFEPDEVVLQLPPTGLDKKTQTSIQAGFRRNIAAVSSLKIRPVIKDVLRVRASLGCYQREQARKDFWDPWWDYARTASPREQIQMANTHALAYDSVKAAEADMS
jgi:hypothetical protein